jgi:SAM-dependent methyltransferase
LSDYLSTHLEARRTFAERNGQDTPHDRRRNRFFHDQVDRLVASQIVPHSRVIDVGCATGATLAACSPSSGIGVDLDASALARARASHPDQGFLESPVEHLIGTPLDDPDYVILSMVLDEVYDVQHVLEVVHEWTAPSTRLVIVTYSRLWRPFIALAERLRLKVRADGENYVPWVEVENLLALSGFEVTKRLDGVLAPLRVPLLSRFINRWIAPLPLIRQLCLVRITIARPKRSDSSPVDSVSVVVAARNESGHIRELIERLPQLASKQELIFVEGGSTDDTWAVIQECVQDSSAGSSTKLIALQQTGKGKGDAVRAGFAAATGDLLMILDADLSVPPEELPKFVRAISDDACEFANGSRLVYPMEAKAMRFLNIIGNKFFGYAFSYLLGQPIRDTLCGTKVLRRSSYERIASNRNRYGDFDPFGDFDLLFGASGLAMRIRDVPVHYKERTYGTTNISRFSHGLLLLRMCSVAAKRLKFVG